MLENFVPFCPALLHYCCQFLYNLERINEDDDCCDLQATMEANRGLKMCLLKQKQLDCSIWLFDRAPLYPGIRSDKMNQNHDWRIFFWYI